ncbi:hypothetical protein ACFQ14_00870 [Pseudahrensia aquimaris]|uniref:Uncharacterized protein n=1 Tax=Pseudahrensia aquimaris TaxID=744461 RepID=A0ABW3FEX1_9HYPH
MAVITSYSELDHPTDSLNPTITTIVTASASEFAWLTPLGLIFP